MRENIFNFQNYIGSLDLIWSNVRFQIIVIYYFTTGFLEQLFAVNSSILMTHQEFVLHTSFTSGVSCHLDLLCIHCHLGDRSLCAPSTNQSFNLFLLGSLNVFPIIVFIFICGIWRLWLWRCWTVVKQVEFHMFLKLNSAQHYSNWEPQ